jgi:hypothetical protein
MNEESKVTPESDFHREVGGACYSGYLEQALGIIKERREGKS